MSYGMNTAPAPAPEAKQRSRAVNRVESEVNKWAELRAMLGAEEEIDVAALFDTLDGETELTEALNVILEELSQQEELLVGIKAREETLKTRKARVQRTIASMRGVLESAVLRSGTKTYRLAEATLSLNRVPPAAVVEDEAALPSHLFDLPPSVPVLDKKKLLDELKVGEATKQTILEFIGKDATTLADETRAAVKTSLESAGLMTPFVRARLDADPFDFKAFASVLAAASPIPGAYLSPPGVSLTIRRK